jgi:hypothetical protein
LFDYGYNENETWYKKNIFRKIMGVLLALLCLVFLIPSIISVLLYFIGIAGDVIIGNATKDKCYDYSNCNLRGLVYFVILLGNTIYVIAYVIYPIGYIFNKFNITNRFVIIIGIICMPFVLLYYVPIIGIIISKIFSVETFQCYGEDYHSFMVNCTLFGMLMCSVMEGVGIFIAIVVFISYQIIIYFNTIHNSHEEIKMHEQSKLMDKPMIVINDGESKIDACEGKSVDDNNGNNDNISDSNNEISDYNISHNDEVVAI